MDRLGGQAQMAHHRDVHLREGFDGVGDLDAAFQFDAFGSAFLNEAARVDPGFLDGNLV